MMHCYNNVVVQRSEACFRPTAQFRIGSLNISSLHWQTDEQTDGQPDGEADGARQPMNHQSQTILALQIHWCMLVLIWTPARLSRLSPWGCRFVSKQTNSAASMSPCFTPMLVHSCINASAVFYNLYLLGYLFVWLTVCVCVCVFRCVTVLSDQLC